MQPGMDTSYSLSSSSGGGGGSGSGGIVSSSFTALSQPGRFVRFFLATSISNEMGSLFYSQNDIQGDRQTERQTGKQMNRQTYIHVRRQTVKQIYR